MAQIRSLCPRGNVVIAFLHGKIILKTFRAVWNKYLANHMKNKINVLANKKKQLKKAVNSTSGAEWGNIDSSEPELGF